MNPSGHLPVSNAASGGVGLLLERHAPVLIGLLVLAAAGLGVSGALAGASALISNPLLPVAVPVAFAAALALLVRPDAVLLAIIATRAAVDPVLELMKQDNGLSPGAAINAMTLMLLLVALVRRPLPLIKFRVLIWLPFLTLAALAMRDASDPSKAARMLMIYLSYFAMFALPLSMIRDADGARRFLMALLAASVVPTLAGLVDFASGGVEVGDPDVHEEEGGPPIADYTGFRIEGLFSHPNIYAFFQLGMIVTLLYLVKSSLFRWRVVQRRLLTGYLLLQIGLLLATQTRSAWIAVGLLFLAYGVLVERRFIVYMMSAVPVLLLLPPIQDRIAEAVFGAKTGVADQMTSYAWRLEMWGSAWPWILEKPFTGWGLDSYTEYSGVFFPLEFLRPHDAHNVFLQLAFELGFPGSIAFVLVFLVLTVSALRRWGQARLEAVLIAFGAIGFLLTCYSDNVHRYLVSNWYLLFLFGTLSAIMALRTRGSAGDALARPGGSA